MEFSYYGFSFLRGIRRKLWEREEWVVVEGIGKLQATEMLLLTLAEIEDSITVIWRRGGNCKFHMKQKM